MADDTKVTKAVVLNATADEVIVLEESGRLTTEDKLAEHNTLCQYTAPLAVQISPPQILPRYAKATVTCTGKGPHISLKLLKVEPTKVLKLGLGFISIEVVGVQENLGLYECLIKSAVHEKDYLLTNRTQLTSEPVFYTSNTTHFIADIYNTLYLNCSYYAFPRGNLQVLKDGYDFYVKSDTLSKRIKTEKSIYWCGIEYEGKEYIKYTQITDGRWKAMLEEIILDPREPITMKCSVNNVAVFEFFINDTPVEEIPGIEVGRDYIYIGEPNYHHVGAVYCQLPGTNKRNYGAIKSAPLVSLPKVMWGTVNTEFKLFCNVTAHPRARLVWYTKYEEVSQLNPLVFKPAYKLNSTNLVCKAFNSQGNSRAQTVLFLHDLIIVNNQTHFEVDEFDTLEIECEAKGMPPISYEWRSAHSRISDEKTVQILDITRDKPKSLICAACSPLSCKKKVFKISVRGKPMKLNPPFVGNLNETHLLIDWEYRPNVTYNLYFLVGDSQPVISRNLITNSTAIERRKGLNRVRLGVSATNEYGTSIVSYTWPPFNLFIPAPKDLTFTELGATFVDIEWNPTECDKYVVTVISEMDNFTILTADTRLRVRGLVGWSEYSIVVIPRAEGKSGPSSNHIIIRTFAQKLQNPVENVKAEMYEKSEVYLSWDPPKMLGYNGLLEGFKVLTEILPDETEVEYIPGQRHQSNRVKRQALQTVTLNYAARSYLKRNLALKQKYKFTIVAIATAGPGPPTYVSIDTKYDKNITPDQIKAWFADEDNIHVSWVPLTGMTYSVKWWLMGKEPNFAETKKAGEGMYCFTDISKVIYSMYVMRII